MIGIVHHHSAINQGLYRLTVPLKRPLEHHAIDAPAICTQL